ncbi:MAG: hypothetical protein ABI638_00895 [Ignavibacteriota bacterium]
MSSRNKYFRNITFIMCLIFIYTTFGYLVIYKPIKELVKVSAKKSVTKDSIDSKEFNKFVFSLKDIENNLLDFRWREDNEFELNGMMYDVKNKIVEGDSITLICRLDSEENVINLLFSMLLQNNKKDASNNHINITFLFGLYLQNLSDNFNRFNHTYNDNLTFSKNEKGFQNYLMEIPTPPPRLFS